MFLKTLTDLIIFHVLLLTHAVLEVLIKALVRHMNFLDELKQ